jgi:hypothetical protein
MLTAHNARIITAYAALFTVAAGILARDLATRAEAPLPDLTTNPQAAVIFAEKARRSERSAALRRMNKVPGDERKVAKK